MNTKKKLSLLLIVVLVLSLTLGTLAFYRKTFTSDNNKIRAARFTVHSDGTLDGDEKFDLTEEPIYPGVELEVYEFKIDKTGTEVPVEYKITVTPYDELFAPVSEGNSPVNLTVLRKVGEEWVDIGGLNEVVVAPDNDIEEFRIDLKWDHSDYDIEYQGKPGKVRINVEAEQVNGELQPGDPEPDPDPEIPELTTWYFKWGASQYVVLENIDIEDAVTYKVTVEGIKLGNIAKIGKALNVSIDVSHPIESYILHVYGPRPWDGRPAPLLWEGEIKNPEFKGNFPPDDYL